MRCTPPSAFRKKGNRAGPPLHDLPGEGTKLRAIYDFFHQRRGVPVEFSFPRHNDLRELTDYWGLDFRQTQRSNRRSGIPAKWVLAGEWFGKVYVDYIAEHLKHDEERAA